MSDEENSPKKPAREAGDKAAHTKETAEASKSSAHAKDSAAAGNKVEPTKETVEAEKKAIDDIITRSSSSGEKKKKLDEISKQAADDIIRRKPSANERHKAADDIKKNASAARKNAQVKILGQSYVSDPNIHLERLADTFDQSARRWEMVVYPTLFAFILLAGYGFYLIYHLTHDIAVLSQSVTRMATIISDATPKVTKDMRDMSGNISAMSGEINSMSNQMTSLTPMNQNLANMTYTMASMNRSVYGMQRDVGGLNRTMSGGPFGFMNDAMPFQSNSYSRPPPPLPPMIMQQPVTQPMTPPASPRSSNESGGAVAADPAAIRVSN
jgi:hypothetical protein